MFRRYAILAALGILTAFLAWQTTQAQLTSGVLPRFTEEREAAALHFVKKHLPELSTLLDQLKKDVPAEYQKEITEIFQVSEILSEMRDEPRRHDLELKIWITESKADILAAKLSTPSEEDRKKVQAQLQELAKQLLSFDIESLEIRAEQLERELGETRDELSKVRDNKDKHIKERYDALLERAQRGKK